MPIRQQLAAIATALLLSVNSYAGSEIVIENAWVRTAPPTAKVLAAYMEISNHGTRPHSLISASSPQFRSVELHRSQMHNGMMRMEAVKQIVIDQGETLHITPGGYHFMLMGPKGKIRRGDKVTLKLHFSEGGVVEVAAEVRDAASERREESHHHHHD